MMGGKFGHLVSEETRRKISESNKGRRPTPEQTLKKIKAQTGKKRTLEQRQRISNSLKGKKLSEEHRLKIRFNRLGKPSWNKGMKIRNKGSSPTTRIGGRKGNKYYVSHINWCRDNQIHRVPDGCVIHHIDGDQFNNEPENLQLMTKGFHSSLHHQYNKSMKGDGMAITT